MNIKRTVTQLTDELGEERVLTRTAIGADYCHDEYPGGSYAPDAVIEARTTEEVSRVLKVCCENGVFVTVRGAGTGQAGGSVAINGGIVLSVKGMNGILGFNAEDNTLSVQAGALLQDVKSEAAAHGLYYPPDPGEKTATIGGNAATDAAGPCAVKYGSTADYIVDGTAVLADGSVIRLGDAKDIIGSEGTLGVITELTLRLIEKPKADAILLLPFIDTETCVNAAGTILKNGCEPAVLEYMDTDIIEFSGNVTGNPVFPVELDGERVAATLMVVLEGEDDDNVMEKMEALAELAEELECLDILVGDTPTMKKDMWAAHDAFHTSMESGAKNAFEYNITVPSEHIAEMVEYAKQLGKAKGLKVMAYAHAGSGGMHIHAVSDGDKTEFKTAVAETEGELYAKCVSLGGGVRGEYGFGYAKKAYTPADVRAAFAASKNALDPKKILNYGKVAEIC